MPTSTPLLTPAKSSIINARISAAVAAQIREEPYMKKPVLVVMAAGMGSRYGGMKQIDPVR